MPYEEPLGFPGRRNQLPQCSRILTSSVDELCYEPESRCWAGAEAGEWWWLVAAGGHGGAIGRMIVREMEWATRATFTEPGRSWEFGGGVTPKKSQDMFIAW